MTQLREEARYVDGLRRIGGLGLESGEVDLQTDPTDFCARA